MNAAWNIASRRRFAIGFCIALAMTAADQRFHATAGAVEAVRVQVLWSSPAPVAWEGSIAAESATIAEFRPLGVSPDEANVFGVQVDRIEVSAAAERLADGCEFIVPFDATLRVALRPVDQDAQAALNAELSIAELFENPDGTTVRAGERELTIRRAPHDRLSVEPLEPNEIYEAGAQIACVSRHRIEQATSVALDWKASLVSLRDGTVAWTEERSSEPQSEGTESKQEWDVPLPETEGVYRLAVEAYPRRFASRWYRGEAIVSGSYDFVALGKAPPVAESTGKTILTIRPGESSWGDRVRSVSPVRWFGFSADDDAGEQGAAHSEQDGDTVWLVLEPGAIRFFPLPADPGRKGFAVEIDVASGVPSTIEVACCRGALAGSTLSEAFENPAIVSWRTALVIPDLPAPSPTTSPVETLRVLLPNSAEEGTLLVRAADPARPVRLAEIRVVEETSGATIASDREFSLSSQSRTATLAIEDLRWPSRLSDGIAPAATGPRNSTRLQWYEASLRLARYAKAEGYDRVCIPAVAEGGALFASPGTSPRLINGPDVQPAEALPPVDALQILLAVFDRERIGLTLAYSPADEESFDVAALAQRWQDLLDRGVGHPSFSGCLLRLPKNRFDAGATARSATEREFRNFEQALGLTLPSEPALRASFLARNDSLWKEWQATQAVRDLNDLRSAAIRRHVDCCVEIGSDAAAFEVDELPVSASLLERSGWTLWRRNDFVPRGPASLATRGVRFAGPAGELETASTANWIRRASYAEAAVESDASRIDAAGERHLLTELALRDASGVVESDRSFAPSFDPELARLRRTLSALPGEALASATRRTPLGDEPLRVRAVRREDGLYVVAINLAPWPIRAAVEFGSGDVGRTRSLTERSVPEPTVVAGSAVWSIDLNSFDVIAVRFENGNAEIADWRTVEPPAAGIDPVVMRDAIDDLSRRLGIASDAASRPSLYRETFAAAQLESAGWRIDAAGLAKLSRPTIQGDDEGAVAIAPAGASLRLTTPVLATPVTRSATVAIVARVMSSLDRPPTPPNGATPGIRLVALSGAASVTTHVSARVDLIESVASSSTLDDPEWRQIYVPIENVPEDFWQDWTVTLEVVGEGTLLIDEISILDGYPSPERLSAWRKQLAIAEYALREKRVFAAYEALNSPSMRLVRECFDPAAPIGKSIVAPQSAKLDGAASVADERPAEKPVDERGMPFDERGMIERLWNWRRPEPVFR